MSLLGLTIAYSPFGWLEPFELEWTPNTTDVHYRRYSVGQQPASARWNLERLAESLCPLFHFEIESLPAEAKATRAGQAREVISSTLDVYDREWQSAFHEMFLSKLGLNWNQALLQPHLQILQSSIWQEQTKKTVEQFWTLLPELNTDYTLSFLALTEWLEGHAQAADVLCLPEMPPTASILYAPLTQ